MCEGMSAIVGPNWIRWNMPEFGESHSEIRRRYNLRDDMFETDGVPVEITPAGVDYSAPLESWIFKIDCNLPKPPEWWNADEAEAAVRAELPNWYLAHKCLWDGEFHVGFWISDQGAYSLSQTGDLRLYQGARLTAPKLERRRRKRS